VSTSIIRQIADLERASMADLQQRWSQLIGADPPRYNRDFLIRRLAHRLQELTHGGLAQASRVRMDQILEEAGFDELGALHADRRPAQGRRELPVVGTRLLREWNGERHEVVVVAGGFAYQGRRYRSLSSIASAITGTHWNGPAFFGLRSKQNGRAR
jgi:hypothetical protein